MRLTLTEDALKYAKLEQAALLGSPEVERGYLAENNIREIRERYFRIASEEVKQQDPNEATKWLECAEMERSKAEECLEYAIYNEQFAATACCLKLADIRFDRKEYEKTIEICNKALSTPQSQPSARNGYFLYLIAMSEEAILFKNERFGDEAHVLKCYQDYIGAYRCNRDRPGYLSNIRDRMSIIEAKSGIPAPPVS